MNIYPTGECFEDCTLKFTEMLRNPILRANPLFFLVHGICLLENGEPYSHAWLELDGTAIQSGILNGEKIAVCMPINQFHKEMRVQDFTRYHWRQLIGICIEHGNAPPPWEEKYKRLTKEGKRK